MAAETSPLNIIVTGAASGVGQASMRLLSQRGYRVFGTVSGTADANLIRANGGIPVFPEMKRASALVSLMMMARADVVIHLAGEVLIGVPQHRVDFPTYEETHLASTEAVMTAAGKAEVSRVISLSATYVYGNTDGGEVDENSPVSRDPLFSSALQAEEIILDGGVPGIVLRSGYIYGGDSEAMIAMRERLQASKALPSGSGFANWIHEQDLASAIVLLAEREADEAVTADIFNIVDDSPISPNDFARQFSHALGLLESRISSGGFMPLMRDKTTQEILLEQSFKVKNDKAKEQLGWKPKHTDQTSGFEDTMLVWRARDAVTSLTTAEPVPAVENALVEVETAS